MGLVVERVCDWCGRRQALRKPTDAEPDPTPTGWSKHPRAGDVCQPCTASVGQAEREARQAHDTVWEEAARNAKGKGPRP